MIYSVGLTGNIASGKSTVASLFADLGIEVISADQVSRELSRKGSESYEIIVNHFGPQSVLENGELNRRYLRELIFNNPEERLWLENVLHPRIRHELAAKIELCKTPYCVIEIPLLLNRQDYPYLNKILVVTAPVETQINRVMQRDQISREHALAIIAAQPNLSERINNADDVIINDNGYEKLKDEVHHLHVSYLCTAQLKNK